MRRSISLSWLCVHYMKLESAALLFLTLPKAKKQQFSAWLGGAACCRASSHGDLNLFFVIYDSKLNIFGLLVRRNTHTVTVLAGFIVFFCFFARFPSVILLFSSHFPSTPALNQLCQPCPVSTVFICSFLVFLFFHRPFTLTNPFHSSHIDIKSPVNTSCLPAISWFKFSAHFVTQTCNSEFF